MATKPLTFIDLFSGCGGLSLGFEQSGFKGLLAIDLWQDALTTYSYNRKNARTYCGDLSTISPCEIKDQFNIINVDVIIGGPPCQGFSVAGKRIIDDKRNELYKAFVNFVRVFKPKAFVMENVPTILTMGNGIIRDAILSDFSSLGYNVSYEVELGIRLKPFCYVVKLLYIAQNNKQLLSKQEIGYYVLNNLDVLQGKVPAQEVFERIMFDRANGIKRSKLSGSNEWQHIKEQFNLLELANIIDQDSERIWLNKDEANSIALFIKSLKAPYFDVASYNLSTVKGRKLMLQEWKEYNGRFNMELLISDMSSIPISSRDELKASKTAIKSTTDFGDEGEAFVFKLEQNRVRAYKERLVNKVLLLGKTKGLGYDIASIEANENPSNPEFARYIEVKATKRTTRPSFNQTWSDSLNITRKEWIAAQQFGSAYNIYRVYFTKTEIIVVRIQNPFALSQEGKIEVVPTIYQMDFGADVLQTRYPI